MTQLNSKFEKPELTVAELNKSLYELSIRLQEANNKLHSQERERLAFYANISHDLRSPITAISNSIELLEGDIPLSEEEYKSTLKLLRNRTDYMKQLINDIFFLSSLETTKTNLHLESVDICFFLEDYFYMCEADSSYQNYSLAIKIDSNLSEVSPSINLDPYLFQRVLDNLFSNAKKYSPEHTVITLTAKLINDSIEISICDQGIGIAQENLSNIFIRSYRVDKSRSPSSNSSSGLGLSIVKAIVELHNGTIHCESQLNKGSKFVITLPYKKTV